MLVVVQAQYVAAMGVGQDDWSAVSKLVAIAPTKVIPCFGLHPWRSHLYSSQAYSGKISLVADTKDPEQCDAHFGDTLLSEVCSSVNKLLQNYRLRHP